MKSSILWLLLAVLISLFVSNCCIYDSSIFSYLGWGGIYFSIYIAFVEVCFSKAYRRSISFLSLFSPIFLIYWISELIFSNNSSNFFWSYFDESILTILHLESTIIFSELLLIKSPLSISVTSNDKISLSPTFCRNPSVFKSFRMYSVKLCDYLIGGGEDRRALAEINCYYCLCNL